MASLSNFNSSFAELVPLGDDDLRRIVPGATIAIDTPLGASLPIRFGRDGLMAGEAGSLAPFLGAAKDRGRWWVERGRLCQKWFRWFDAEPRCVSLSQDGNRFHWRQDSGRTGTATMTAAAPSPPAQVAAMSPPSPAAQPIQAGTAAAPPAVPVQPAPRKASADATPVAPPAAHPRKAPPAAPSVGTAAAPAQTGPRSWRPAVTVAKPAAPQTATSGTPAGVQIPARNPLAVAREANARPVVATAPATPPSYLVPHRTFRVRGVHPTDKLNVRSGPSSDHTIVGAIAPNGRRIRLAGTCVADWCMVRADRVVGWVNIGFLAPERMGRDSASSWTRQSLGGMN